jgi:hypothetical protein
VFLEAMGQVKQNVYGDDEGPLIAEVLGHVKAKQRNDL